MSGEITISTLKFKKYTKPNGFLHVKIYILLNLIYIHVDGKGELTFFPIFIVVVYILIQSCL